MNNSIFANKIKQKKGKFFKGIETESNPVLSV